MSIARYTTSATTPENVMRMAMNHEDEDAALDVVMMSEATTTGNTIAATPTASTGSPIQTICVVVCICPPATG